MTAIGSARWTKWALAGEAAMLIVIVRIGVRILPYGALRSVLDRIARVHSRSTVDSVARIAGTVRGVGRRMPGNTCLIDALAAETMLRRRAVDCELRLGVRKPLQRSGRVEGHAWLEHRGHVVLGMLDDLTDFEVMSAPPLRH